MTEYTQEQIERVYEKLPDELQEAIFSVETADAIRNACEKQGITDARVGEVASQVGLVLMGLLLPDEFSGVLEQTIGLKKEVASPLAHEINRFVFFPVKEALNQIHSVVTEKSGVSSVPVPPQEEVVLSQQEPPKKVRPKKADTYKEQVDEE